MWIVITSDYLFVFWGVVIQNGCKDMIKIIATWKATSQSII